MKRRLRATLRVLVYWISANYAFAHPGSGIVVDQAGQVFFTDTGEGIWKIDEKGGLTLVSKQALHWMTSDIKGGFAIGPAHFSHFERITPRDAKPALIVSSDYPCAAGEDGNLYYADTRGPTKILRLSPDGKEAVVGEDASPAFGLVTGIAADPHGEIFIMDTKPEAGTYAVRKIARNGTTSTVAANFLPKVDGKVKDVSCRGLAVDARGDVFVAAVERRYVIRITPAGEVNIALTAEAPWSPTGVVFSGNRMLVLEYSDFPPGWDKDDRKGWVPRVRSLESNGEIVTLATVSRNWH